VSGASSRRKGNRAEVDVVRVLREAGFQAETSRAARGGFQSGEDIASDFPASIEVKNQTRMDLSGWYGQAVEQRMVVLLLWCISVWGEGRRRTGG
jgi:hypothetical protein